MSQTTYQVILSADGNHQVIVTTDNQGETTLALAWAKATYDKMVGQDGPRDATRPDGDEAPGQAPLCAIHGVPMVWVDKGRRGPFWSCHQKNEDGSWCSDTRQPSEV